MANSLYWGGKAERLLARWKQCVRQLHARKEKSWTERKCGGDPQMVPLEYRATLCTYDRFSEALHRKQSHWRNGGTVPSTHPGLWTVFALKQSHWQNSQCMIDWVEYTERPSLNYVELSPRLSTAPCHLTNHERNNQKTELFPSNYIPEKSSWWYTDTHTHKYKKFRTQKSKKAFCLL